MIALSVIDANRRVVQCECGRSMSWRGIDAVRVAGWTRTWTPRTDATGAPLAVAWWCPEHVRRTPSPTLGAPGALSIPLYLREAIHSCPEIALEQFELLRERHPERFSAYVEELVEGLEQLPDGLRARWENYLATGALGARPPARRRGSR